MNGKRRSLVLITILSIIAVLSISLLAFLLIFDADIEYSFVIRSGKNKTIYNNAFNASDIKNIDIKTDEFDIEVKKSKDDKIKLKINGSEKDNADVNLTDGVLLVNENNNKKGHIGFFFESNKKMVFYIPENMVCDINIQSDSGDLAIADFENINLSFKSDSGDIAISKLSSAHLELDSGDVAINEIKTVDIKTDSGDVAIKNLIMTANSKISSDSGDIVINKTGKCFIDAKTDSGDIVTKKSDRMSLYELKIETDSGDIVVK